MKVPTRRPPANRSTHEHKFLFQAQDPRRLPAGRSATLTALLLGSQFGLAENYTRQADAVVAAKRAQPVAQQASPAARRLRG